MEQAVDELEEKLAILMQPFKDLIKEISLFENIDFLLKDNANLFSFAKRPSRSQMQKFTVLVNGLIDLATKVYKWLYLCLGFFPRQP